jgi:hypothetical protein
MFRWISFEPPKIEILRLLKYRAAALACSGGAISRLPASASAGNGAAAGPSARRARSFSA